LKIYKKTLIFCLIESRIFFCYRIPTRGLFCDHGLLWSKDAPQFGVFSKEKIEFFIDLNI
jgi:hypothetical protein